MTFADWRASLHETPPQGNKTGDGKGKREAAENAEERNTSTAAAEILSAQ